MFNRSYLIRSIGGTTFVCCVVYGCYKTYMTYYHRGLGSPSVSEESVISENQDPMVLPAEE